MALQNLLKIGQLRSHAPSAFEIERLLAAIRRNLADARVTAVSTETRFDAAYKAIMQAALSRSWQTVFASPRASPAIT